MKGYILFVGQEANFCGRAMLIPYEPFIKVRGDDYELLKNHAQKNVSFDIDDGKSVVVANLLLQNVVWKNGFGTEEQHPWTAVCNELKRYAEYGSEYGYTIEADKEWVEQCVHVQAGFNHIKTYAKAMETGHIVDSFVVLEAEGGEIRGMPPCDTAEEMFAMFYSEAADADGVAEEEGNADALE